MALRRTIMLAALKRIIVLAAITVGALVALVGYAGARGAGDNHAAYDFIAGEEPLEGPNVAAAPNGDTVALEGNGSFKAGPDGTATGGGTFTIENPSGQTIASGEWSVTRVMTFVSYGNGVPQGLPPNFFGGKVKLKVSLGDVGRGVSTINCELGKIPPGQLYEGVKLVLGHGWNFTKSPSGQTLFIRN